MRKFAVAGSSMLALAMAVSGQAIVWRHDIAESQILNLGNSARFQGVGRITVGGGIGTGTFLGFNGSGQAWGLSAKHVITTGNTGTFSFENGQSFNIVQAIGLAGTDVSVFRLSSFNSGVFTPKLNMSATFATGTNIESAGYGLHAPQGQTQTLDNKRRGMQSIIDGTENITFGGSTFLAIRDRFLSPTNLNVRPLQAFGAAGDSGSALFTDSGTLLGVLTGGETEIYNNRNWYAALTPAISQQIITLTGVVPEPATMAALGLGVLAMARRRRRR